MFPNMPSHLQFYTCLSQVGFTQTNSIIFRHKSEVKLEARFH